MNEQIKIHFLWNQMQVSNEFPVKRVPSQLEELIISFPV